MCRPPVQPEVSCRTAAVTCPGNRNVRWDNAPDGRLRVLGVPGRRWCRRGQRRSCQAADHRPAPGNATCRQAAPGSPGACRPSRRFSSPSKRPGSPSGLSKLHGPAVESQLDKHTVNVQLIYELLRRLHVDIFGFSSVHRAWIVFSQVTALPEARPLGNPQRIPTLRTDLLRICTGHPQICAQKRRACRAQTARSPDNKPRETWVAEDRTQPFRLKITFSERTGAARWPGGYRMPRPTPGGTP